MGGLLTWNSLKAFNSKDVKKDADDALKAEVLESDKSWIVDEEPQSWDRTYHGKDPKNVLYGQTDRRASNPDFCMEPVGGPRF